MTADIRTAAQREKPVQVSNTSEETRTLFSRECKGVAPQAVVNAANVIMKEWTTQQETAKLIGDYPPKKWSN